MTQLSIEFKAVECNGWPNLRFLIDQDIQQEFTFTEPTALITLDLDLLDGLHELEIERYGKTDQNVIFLDNEIKKDQTVELVDLWVNDIKLPDLFKYQGVYYYSDQKIPSALLWGLNGKFVWNFETPLINWIIAQKKQASGEVVDLLDFKKNFTSMMNMLDQFEQELHELKNQKSILS